MAEGKVLTRGTKVKSDTEPASISLHSIDSKLNSILGMLEKNASDIKDIKNEQKDMCASIELCHSYINDIKQDIKGQSAKTVKCEEDILNLKSENNELRRQIRNMEGEIRDIEQYSHRNNLIVYGIPEDKGENIHHVVRRLAAALQFPDWSTGLIDAVHRMGKSIDSKPRPIIIKFVSRLDREMFWARRKVRRNLKATDLGFSSENPIYVNESLTPTNRELLKKTREAARVKGYSQVWTANCSIFIRREKGQPAIKIASDSDLDRL